MISDSAVRFLGADPGVYRPIARAQGLILKRKTRMGRAGRGLLRGLTPAQFRYVTTAIFSVYFSRWILGTPAPLAGAAFTLTAGAAFLLVDLLFDKFDVLADPNEYQVIAAHPHDAWSVVLAKIVAVGQSIAILAACAFTLPAIATGIAFHSVGAGLAYVAAAIALTFTISAGGMLATAAVVSMGGQTALHRVLPFFHGIYALMYLGVFLGRSAILRLAAPSIEALGWWKWALPPMWFIAPVEWATGKAGATTLARAALAVGSFAVLLPLSARWIRTRFDERILEPVTRRARSKARGHVASRGARPGWTLGMRVFMRLFFAHLRSDVSVRGGIMSAFIMPVVMIVSSQASSQAVKSFAQFTVVMVGMGVGYAAMLLTRVLQTSSRPAALWFLLISPHGRRAFSVALTWAVRIVLLVPAVIGLGIYMARFGGWPVAVRVLYVTMVAIICDTVLVTARGFSSAVPFSLPVRTRRRIQWGAIALFPMIPILLSVLSVVFTLLIKKGVLWCLLPIAFVLVGRVLLGFWAGRRVMRVAREAEAA